MTLDPAGLEAAAKALGEQWTIPGATRTEHAEAAVRAYLAAAPDTGRSVLMHVPVAPTTENPPENVYARLRNRPPEPSAAVAWDEGYVAGFAAGRAAASPDPPDDPGVIPGPDPGACPSCGGWRKAGMIHRCEVEEDAIRADERERLSARVYENGWCPTCAHKVDPNARPFLEGDALAAAILVDPAEVLSPEELAEYERCQQSVMDARRSAPMVEGQMIVGAAASPDERLREWPDEGWSPGIDDPEPPALGDIDTGEGWYQT